MDTKKNFIAYKLLEWAGTCDDRVSFENLSEPIKRNALLEAESILKHIDKLD
jgi:hypothetical protein